mgnify:FL=1
MDGQDLPRAITFTAGFYSIGIPPELIGLGRSLNALEPVDLELVKRHYRNLVADTEKAGRFLNKDNLNSLAKHNDAWALIKTDIEAIEATLNLELGPRTQVEEAHKSLSSDVLLARSNPGELKDLIEEMAGLRGSLG